MLVTLGGKRVTCDLYHNATLPCYQLTMKETYWGWSMSFTWNSLCSIDTSRKLVITVDLSAEGCCFDIHAQITPGTLNGAFRFN